MKMRKLGNTTEMVSEIGLGTMTWGTQNTEAEAHEQMAYALDKGVTMWDTAEMYPVNPASAATYGRTEHYIGNFFAANPGTREQVFLNTKVAGVGRPYIRNGEGFTPQGIKEALENSLMRLKTDHIDLYQLHWPNRGSYAFGNTWGYRPSITPTKELEDDILATLSTLGDLVKEGKIRHIGLSNETAWGTCTFLKLAKEHNLPRVVTIQNEYSLMYRPFGLDLAEVAVREEVGLLAYSPLAGGWLSGKYYHGARPEGARFALPGNGGPQRLTPQAQAAADAWTNLARKHGYQPAHMALAWILAQPFTTAALIGATSMEHLKTNIAAADVRLSAEALTDIAVTLRDHPMPY